MPPIQSWSELVARVKFRAPYWALPVLVLFGVHLYDTWVDEVEERVGSAAAQCFELVEEPLEENDWDSAAMADCTTSEFSLPPLTHGWVLAAAAALAGYLVGVIMVSQGLSGGEPGAS